MSLILTTLSDNTISVLNTDTNVQTSYTSTRCKWSVHLNPPAVTYVYYEDQLICAVSDDLSLYPGSSILGAFDATTAVIALTAQPLLTSTLSGGTSGGTATTVDISPASIAKLTPGTALDPVGSPSTIGLLKRLVQLGQDDRDFTEIILTETTGLKRTVVRQTVYNEDTGLFSTSFVNVDGTALVPPVVLPVVPAVSSDDIEIVSFSYHASAAGTGYSVNHLLEQVRLINTATSSIISTIWFNRTTGLVLATAPNVATLKPDVHQLEDIAQSTLNVSGYQKIRLYYISNVNDPGNGTSIGDLIEAQDTYRGDVFDSTVYTNLSTGLAVPVAAGIPDWLPIDYENYLAVKNTNNLLTAATDPLTAPYVNITDSFSGSSASVVPGGTAVDNTSNQLAIGISPDSNSVQITGTGNTAAVLTSAAVSGTPALAVTISPNSSQPNITPFTRAYVQLTDGSNLALMRLSLPNTTDAGVVVRSAPDAAGNTQVISGTIGTALFSKLTDGTNSLSLLNVIPPATTFAVPVRQVPNTVTTPFFNSISNGAISADVDSAQPLKTANGLVVKQANVDSAGNTVKFGLTSSTAGFVRLTDGTNDGLFLTTPPLAASSGLVTRLAPDAAGDTVKFGSTVTTAPFMQLTDGTDTIDITAAVPATTAFGLPVRLIPDALGHTVNFGSTNASAPFTRLSDGTNTVSFTAATPAVASFGVPTRSIPDTVGNTQTIASTVGTALYSRITDGVNFAVITTALPAVSTSGIVVRQAPNAAGNTQIVSSTPATALYSRITNGTIEPVITAATVTPIAADPALVVSLSPNSSAVKGIYNATLPVIGTGVSGPLQTDDRGRLLVSAAQPTVQFGTTSPAADLALTAGKKIYRIGITNNSGVVFFLQLFNSAVALATGFVPINGHIYRIPANTTVVLDGTTWSAAGELVSATTRIGFSSTFVNYTAVSGAILSNVALNYKIEA